MPRKMRVVCQKDEHGHLNWIEIYKRSRKPLRLDFIWDAEGLTREIEFSGRRADMPSISDVMMMFNESFIERIGLVKLINLINKIETIENIDLVALIGLITEVTNIKNIESLDLIDLITKITEITTVKTVDKITLVDDITTIGTVTNLGTLNLVNTVSEITTIKKIEHIETIGKDNIVLDLLKKGAYKALKNDLSNDNGVTTPTAPPSQRTNQKFFAKWFMRGCMGQIYSFSIYCKRTASGTITLGYSIAPSMGEIGEITITPSSSWDWKTGILNKLWEYDSLFIYVKNISADVAWGYEVTTTEPDCLRSTDSGVTWTPLDERVFIRVAIRYGTIPITIGGIVNNIPIPNSSSGANSGSISVPTDTETSIITLTGSGNVERVALFTGDDIVEIRFYIDGVMFDRYALLGGEYFTAFNLNALKYSPSTPQIQLMSYVAEGICYFNVTKSFPFKRSFEVRAYHVAENARAVRAGLL